MLLQNVLFCWLLLPPTQNFDENSVQNKNAFGLGDDDLTAFCFIILLYASGITTVYAPASKANGIDRYIACLKNIKSTVSAVTMQAVSAVISITRLVSNISFRFGCFGRSFIFFKPEPKFLNVVITFERKPLLSSSCSR